MYAGNVYLIRRKMKLDKLNEKMAEIIAISKKRKKYGLAVMEVPGLEELSEKEYNLVTQACNHIIEDIKKYQEKGVKLSVGTGLKILGFPKDTLLK